MMLRDREEAGRLLGEKLRDLSGRDVVVLGLPRGGVAVARPIADALKAPLGVLVARKLRAPNQPELAIGAVTANGTRVLYRELLRTMLLPPGYLERETEAQRELAVRQARAFERDRGPIALAGRTVLLVDDGIATGMTMFAAIEDAKAQRPAAIVVVAPVIAPRAYDELRRRVHSVVVLAVPELFYMVGQFYEDFTQVEDEQVLALLGQRVG